MKTATLVVNGERAHPALRLYIDESGKASLTREQLTEADRQALREIADVLNRLAGKPQERRSRRRDVDENGDDTGLDL